MAIYRESPHVYTLTRFIITQIYPNFMGASTIATRFSKNVKDDGVHWTVDQIIVDPDRCIGVLEFARFDGKGGILPGLELYEFDPVSLRILEVRPYTAAPIDFGLPRQELHAGRGYPTTRPA
jgi:hypothetical protein